MAIEAVTEKDTGIYWAAKGAAWVLLHTVMPVRYHGMEKLRELEGPAVVISNHVHALDPLILAMPVRQQCVFLGKKELGKRPWVQRLLTGLHCILVDRHHMDMEAMRACIKAIRLKKTLVIFPEGTRHHEGQMEQIENGTSLIVLRSQAPLLPVYLDKPLKPFRRVNAYVGEYIDYADLAAKGANSESCGELNERMRAAFRKMIAAHPAD